MSDSGVFYRPDPRQVQEQMKTISQFAGSAPPQALATGIASAIAAYALMMRHTNPIDTVKDVFAGLLDEADAIYVNASAAEAEREREAGRLS